MPQLNSRPLVSVIIPTFNRAEFIAATIDSVLNQSWTPHEIIVVDDGSTDETPEILLRYGSLVRTIRQENRGRSAARNAGLQIATGDAILFLDSDDLLMPEFIERCGQVLEKTPSVDIVYTDAHVIDVNSRVVARYSNVLIGRRPSGMIFSELARRCVVTVCSMVRRSSLADVRFDEGLKYSEDYDLWRRLAARCNFQYVDEPLMAYRFHDGMSVASDDRQTQEGTIEVQRRFMAMPEFGRLPRSERARFYCTYGIKNAMLDRTDVARRVWWKAARTCPTYPGAVPLVAMSLLGKRLLRYAIVMRRQLAGNQLGTLAGPLAIVLPKRAADLSQPPDTRSLQRQPAVAGEQL